MIRAGRNHLRPIGREKVHYTALTANRLAAEMGVFLDWFEQPGELNPVLKAGLAHLWFVTLHPFDDGNGRIARAVGDMVLARSEQCLQRFYSLSAQIQQERTDYYNVLKRSQKGDLDVTEWLLWFLACLQRAIARADETLSAVLAKAKFWERFASAPMNKRQIKVLNRLLDGFESKLTTSKWAKLAKCSQDTAYRDILTLIELGALIKADGGGRSTSYELAFPAYPAKTSKKIHYIALRTVRSLLVFVLLQATNFRQDSVNCQRPARVRALLANRLRFVPS